MTDVSNLQNNLTHSPMMNAARNSSSGNDSIQNEFLKMLTAEMKNQDPTNPMDSTQMVTQLSQMSTSQGINNLQHLAEKQMMAMISSQRLASTSLIGKKVNYLSDTIDVDMKNNNFHGHLKGDDEIKSYTLKIADANGTLISTQTITPGQNGKFDWNWNGKDGKGNQVPAGQYKITAEAGEEYSNAKANVVFSDEVKKIQYELNGSTKLYMNNGLSTNLSTLYSIEE